MGLETVFRSAAVTAFSVVTDLLETVTFASKGTSSYNTTTGAFTETGGTTQSVSMLFTDYETREIDGELVRATDVKGLIPTSNLTATPKASDTVTRADSSVWQVVGVKKDPAGALWELQLRKP